MTCSEILEKTFEVFLTSFSGIRLTLIANADFPRLYALLAISVYEIPGVSPSFLAISRAN